MKRKNPLYFILLAVAVTLSTGFLASGIRHGFPFTWVTITDNPVAAIPFVGSLFGWLPPTLDFNEIGFLLNIAFYFAVFYGVYRLATRKK